MLIDESALIEMKTIDDTFATGCGRVDIVGSCARFVMYAEQKTPCGETERVVVAKIVMPIECVPAALAVSAAAISDTDPQAVVARGMMVNMRRHGH